VSDERDEALKLKSKDSYGNSRCAIPLPLPASRAEGKSQDRETLKISEEAKLTYNGAISKRRLDNVRSRFQRRSFAKLYDYLATLSTLQSCIQLRDPCPRLIPPINGETRVGANARSVRDD
jgi:hypothetical protein